MANKIGRPTKYHKKYCKALIKYFEVEPYREIEVEFTDKKGNTWSKYEERANDLPTFAGFSASINVNRDTLAEWCKKHKEFSVAFKRAKELQESVLVTNGLKNLYSSAFAIFTAKNILSWRDKTETDITSQGKQVVGFNFIVPKEDGKDNA